MWNFSENYLCRTQPLFISLYRFRKFLRSSSCGTHFVKSISITNSRLFSSFPKTETSNSTFCVLIILTVTVLPKSGKKYKVVSKPKDKRYTTRIYFLYCSLDILFSSNHNIHKSSHDLCFWASDPLIEKS